MSRPTLLAHDQVTALRPNDVQLYLSGRGWTLAETLAQALVFHHPEQTEGEVLLPLSQGVADYALRMAEVVETLATIENRSFSEILTLLSGPPADTLKLRVVANDATLGTFPLDGALRLLQGGRDMLLAAACSTTRPQAFHPEMTLRPASDFIAGCRLGQTERGSFVANIIAPVPPELHQTGLPFGDERLARSSEPFARRVTTRLMQSLALIEQTARTTRLDPIFGGIEAGVSANLCEAVAALKPPGEQSRVELRMDWSRSRPHLPEGAPPTLSFSETHFAIVAEAGRRLRERAAPRLERFTGRIVQLQAETPSLLDADRQAGRAIIRSQLGGQPVRIKVVLDRDDYRRACDAHRDDQAVAVTGLIHHDVKIRVYDLAEPRGFTILDE